MEDNSWLSKKMNMRKSQIPRRESISHTLAPEVRENLPVLEVCVCLCVCIYARAWACICGCSLFICQSE